MFVGSGMRGQRWETMCCKTVTEFVASFVALLTSAHSLEGSYVANNLYYILWA